MKEGWEVKKLGEVCDFQGGSQPPKNEWTTEPKEGYIRMLQIRDFTQSRSFDIEYVRFSSRLKTCNESDILLGRYGASVGKILTGLSGAYNVAIIKSIPNERIINKPYIKYFFSSQNFQQYLQIVCTQRAAQAGFSKDDINDYPITIPPLSEQSRIVEELDQLSNIIEKKRQQLSELDNLAQSIFYDMFGDPDNSIYEIVKLSEIAKCKMSYGSGASAIQYDGNIRYVRITDIKEDGTLSDEKMSPNVVDDKYMLYEGDILFARSGATVGKTYLYNNKDGKSIYAGYLIRFVADTNIVIPKYIYYYTRTTYYKAFIAASAQAVAQPNINAQQFGNLKVCIPPLELQQLFAQKIEAIEKEKELIKQSIKETEELFNSRMDYYFN